MSGERYKFGPYEARVRTRELYKGGSKLKLRPQPFQVLVVLLERAGQVVTREDLHQVLWPENTFVDFERGLNTSIKELRGVLSDSASRPRYIETLPKLGYRMIAPVETETEVGEPAAELAAADPLPALAAAEASPIPPIPPAVSWWMRPLLAGGLILLVLALSGGVWEWRRARLRAQAASARIMLAVLPFENLTGDASQDYLSDGLTEEMISQLGRLDPEHFGVIALTSAMHYRKTQERLDQIGRELNVQYVLEGGMRGDSNQLRVSAQLIQVQDETPVWARQYDRQRTSLLALQEEIALEISEEIQSVVGHGKPAPRVTRALSVQQSEAHELYLKGLYIWNKRIDFEKAIDYFQQAINKDSGSAPAYAGIANSYLLLAGYSAEPHPENMMSKARSAALRALEIDETLPEAHMALATIVRNYDLDWQTAEREYRRAIELNPNYATAHHWYAEYLGYLGRFNEAFRESERARQLDPLSLIIASDDGVLLYYSRQYDRSIEEFHSVMELDPNSPRADEVFLPYLERGEFGEAVAEVDKEPEGPGRWSKLAYIYGRSGQAEQARHALEKLLEMAARHTVDPAMMVMAYLGAGDKDKALYWLDRAYSQHSNVMTYLKVDPEFDSLRGDPRFQNLLRRAGLAR